MTSQYNTSSWRDDLDLEPNTHPAIAYALQHMRTGRAAKLANQNASARVTAPQRWPFPLAPIPTDHRKPPPRHPDAEEAPL